MGYTYDVFLSYKTGPVFGEWVGEHFLENFKARFDNALGEEAKIFIDQNNIHAGEAWPESLKKALSESKCMVAVWSPLYFKSPWCQKECAVMLYREKRLGFRTPNNPKGLIFPITLNDGDRFPEFAKTIQGPNWCEFARVGEGFRKTERYVEFQDKLEKWVLDLAPVVKNPPPWDPNWIKPKWVDVAGRFDFSLREVTGPPGLA